MTGEKMYPCLEKGRSLTAIFNGIKSLSWFRALETRIPGENKKQNGETMGPTSNPLLVFATIFGFFVGMGFICYLFGKGETASKNSGM